MTQTVSFKEKCRQCLTTFKWELRNCKSPLLIFAILATVGVMMCLAVCFSMAMEELFDSDSILDAVRGFQISASYVVFFLSIVFTVIYTIRIYSYLHDKRKADMYGALPISRRTFYVAKTGSAFLFSVVPPLLYLSVIALISLCFGQLLVSEVVSLYLNLVVGALACVCFYGLLAVCCGTTPNTVISFIFINLAYLAAAAFIRGTLMSFLRGLPITVYADNFIMKALNPASAYGGGNLIYWLLFTAACLALALALIKKRRAECAQTSFAYWLPAYIVKLLIAFNAGMFLGSIFGSLAVFHIAYFGFVFGFVIGSAAGYLVVHMILYRGTDKIFRTAIPLAAMVVVVTVCVAVLHFDWFGYSRYVPKAENVKSAGLVDLSDCYCAGTENAAGIGRMACDDYDSADKIDTIITFHQSVINGIEDAESSPYAHIWVNMLTGGVASTIYDRSGFVVSYKLNNGFTVVRYYEGITGGLYTRDSQALQRITDSKEYFENYSSVMNVSPDKMSALEINVFDREKSNAMYRYSDEITISETGGVDAEKVHEDIRKVVEAYRRDYAEHGAVGAETCSLDISYNKERGKNHSMLGAFFDSLIYSGRDGDSAVVYDTYSETLATLREVGVIDSAGKVNTLSPYYYDNRSENESKH